MLKAVKREREREREREEVGVYQKCDVAPCRGKKVLFPLSKNCSYIDYSSLHSTQLIWQQHVLCVLKAGKREREFVVTVVFPLVFVPIVSQNRYLFLTLIHTLHIVWQQNVLCV